jgi:hypothetical protein
MKETNNITLNDIQSSVNQYLSLDSEFSVLRSELNAEMVLVEHLAKAFQLLDMANPFGIN